MAELGSNIVELPRIGKAAARALGKVGIETVGDLLFYFPFRYDDFSRTLPIGELKIGENANVFGQIELIQNKRSPRRRMYITEALVTDQSGSIRVVWFNQPFITRVLSVGDTVSLAGRVDEDYGGAVLMSPIYEKVKPVIHSEKKIGAEDGGKNSLAAIHTHGLVPVYHLTGNLTLKQIRYAISQALPLASRLKDWLPVEVRKKTGLLSLAEAIRLIHFPKSLDDIERAKKRLSFQELFLIQLQSQLARRKLDTSVANRLKFFEKETREFVESLPFRLTDAQRQAAWEILKDLEKERPMARMLSGDVGSGKTIVAVIAALNAALNGKQSALMVPTEILAAQHFDTLGRLLSAFDIRVSLITSNEKKINGTNKNFGIAGNNKKAGNKTGNGKAPSLDQVIHDSQIIIGTHALIQEDIYFNNLALAIIDEQHRFGVEQRKALIEKSSSKGISKKFVPHFLSMTATPIPRSLALALYGDLDISQIKEMPKGRKKIMTRVIPEEKRPGVYGFIRKNINEGRQAFVICPLIDESDKLGVKSVKAEFLKLDKEIFPDLKIGLLHGKLKPKEKEKVMREFLAGEIKVLVSTSVVEVGIDVPNATIMMIEGADRFGLAQLHQFRGRVGRGEHESYCFLFSDNPSEKTLQRLKAMTEIDNGFELAKFDLRFRGPGEVYGTAQKGFPELKMASLFDYELMRQAKAQVEVIIEVDPTLDKWPMLKEEVGEWEKKIHLE